LSQPILNPARFVPVYGVGYAADTGEVSPVSSGAPLPVVSSPPPSGSLPAPLAGSTSANFFGGPFVPVRGLPITVVLNGVWQGLVRVMRSTDGGNSSFPLTVGGIAWAQFNSNACEAVWEENDPAATFYLEMAISSGTLNYRLGH